MPELDFSGPWEGFEEDNSDASPFLQSHVRLAWGGWSGDGIIDPGTANPARIVAAGTDTNIAVQNFSAVIRGILVTLETNATLDVEDFGGTTPTSGQTRIDRVIVRLDFSAQTAELVVLPGTPATSGAVAATLTQQDDLDGIWEHELGQVRRTGNVAVTSSMVFNTGQRRLAPLLYCPPGVAAPPKAARGTVLVTDTDLLVWRRTDASTPSSLAAVSLLDPPWRPATLATSVWEVVGTGGRAPQWRLFGGMLQLTCHVHKKTGNITTSTSTWSTVATIPVTSLPTLPGQGSADGVAATHNTAHNPSGAVISWRLVVPATGNASLQCVASTDSLSYANLTLFQIPTGA